MTCKHRYFVSFTISDGNGFRNGNAEAFVAELITSMNQVSYLEDLIKTERKANTVIINNYIFLRSDE